MVNFIYFETKLITESEFFFNLELSGNQVEQQQQKIMAKMVVDA